MDSDELQFIEIMKQDVDACSANWPLPCRPVRAMALAEELYKELKQYPWAKEFCRKLFYLPTSIEDAWKASAFNSCENELARVIYERAKNELV